MRGHPSTPLNRHFVAPVLNASALALVLTAATMVSAPAIAADSTSTGTAGANGLPGKNGAAGKGAALDITSTDLTNIATAKAGKAGNGGVSTATAPAGNGGQALSKLTLKGQIYPDEYEAFVAGTVTAVGGDGGNGGLSPVLGKGGAGGFANAKGLDYGGHPPEYTPYIRDSITVNGVGGNAAAATASESQYRDVLGSSALATAAKGAIRRRV